MPASSGSRLSAVGEEAPVEGAADAAFRLQPVEPFQLLPGEAPGLAGGHALEQHVHFIVGRRPDAHRPTDQAGVCEDQLAQLEAGADAHQLREFPPVPAFAHRLGENTAERGADDGPVVGGREGFGVACAGRVEHALVEGDVEGDLGLREGADALVADRADQQDEEAERNADGGDTVEVKPRLGPPPPRQRRQDRLGRALLRVSHSVPGSGARA